MSSSNTSRGVWIDRRTATAARLRAANRRPANRSGALLHHALLAEPLFRWTYDPFAVPAFEGVVLEESPGEVEGFVRVRQRFASASGDYAGLEYTVDVTVEPPRVVSRTTRTAAGAVFTVTEYADHQEIAPGRWRPMRVTETVYDLDPLDNRPRQRTTLTVSSARALDEAEAAAVPAPFPDDPTWIVWE